MINFVLSSLARGARPFDLAVEPGGKARTTEYQRRWSITLLTQATFPHNTNTIVLDVNLLVAQHSCGAQKNSQARRGLRAAAQIWRTGGKWKKGGKTTFQSRY